MPMLVLSVAEDLDELFQNGSLTAIAPLRELGRIMEMAVHASFMLIVRILRPEDRRADGTCEVLDVIFSVERSYV
jgi:hypothetical protein